MKKNYSRSLLFYCIIFLAISCSKIDEFGNINQNPAGNSTPVTSALLTNALSMLDQDVWDAWITDGAGLTTTCGYYCQYFAQLSYPEISNYARPNINWDKYYAGRLYDLQVIINYNTDPETAAKATIYGSNNNQVAVARILKVYLFSLLTDCYGDLPYFNALQGDNGINSFDKQEDIYKNFFRELSEAVDQFDEGNKPVGDILFNGDIDQWKKFANSLHALLALRLSNADAALGKAEFNIALGSAGGVFEAGENAQVIYLGSGQYNEVYNYFARSSLLRIGASKTFTDWLIHYNDSRINAYASSSVGIPYGVTHDDVTNWVNANGDWARLLHGASTNSTDPFPALTAAEIYLARAEAAHRGWTTESATALYEQGIAESWRYWKVNNDSTFKTYMQQPGIALTNNADDLQKICEQEWAAHYPNGPRGFNDWRRTGFPNLIPGPASIASSIPRRFPYGGNTYGTNPDNTNAAAERYVVNGEKDSQWGRVWWDKD